MISTMHMNDDLAQCFLVRHFDFRSMHRSSSHHLVSSFLLTLHHGCHSTTNKCGITMTTNMNLAPEACHEVVAWSFVTIADGASYRMLVVGTHALPNVVIAIACLLRRSEWKGMSDMFLRRFLERLIKVGSQVSAWQ